jgi:hypothetical protein
MGGLHNKHMDNAAEAVDKRQPQNRRRFRCTCRITNENNNNNNADTDTNEASSSTVLPPPPPPDSEEEERDEEGWERTQTLQALAHLGRDCHRYYSKNIRPLVQRLAWMDLFPPSSSSGRASRGEWERMAREIHRLETDRRQPDHHYPPCSERDWDTLQNVWMRILQRCPYDDIVRRWRHRNPNPSGHHNHPYRR